MLEASKESSGKRVISDQEVNQKVKQKGSKELIKALIKRPAKTRARSNQVSKRPCPALVFRHGSRYARRAAAPEGTGRDKVL